MPGGLTLCRCSTSSSVGFPHPEFLIYQLFLVSCSISHHCVPFFSHHPMPGTPSIPVPGAQPGPARNWLEASLLVVSVCKWLGTEGLELDTKGLWLDVRGLSLNAQGLWLEFKELWLKAKGLRLESRLGTKQRMGSSKGADSSRVG